jgi:glycosyltransferase involved in cell wall biosynthesis
MNETKSCISSPLISVLTPILNGAKYLEACISSVLQQNYANIEHIFVDGGSTDKTLEILTKYSSQFPDRIRFVSKPDDTVGEAWNNGVTMAKGRSWGGSVPMILTNRKPS